LNGTIASAADAGPEPKPEPAPVPAPEPAPARVADPHADLKSRVHRACIAKLGTELLLSEPGGDLAERVQTAVTAELALERTPLGAEERARIVREICDDILGYGPLEPFLGDDGITEVMVNGPDKVYVERAGRIEPTSAAFLDDKHLLRIIDKIVSLVGRRIDESSPMVDARLPDGSRVNAVVPPLSLAGPVLTIRKFSRDPYTLDDLVGFGTLTPKAGVLLTAAVTGKLNVLISGGTGTGKTTMLNALSAYVPGEERIVTIEDAAELQLQQEHVVSLESRPANIEGRGEVTIRDLVRNALRMRPDRIIVGEVRGAEALDMLQAMNTGHDGSLTTIHANSPREALGRLEMLVLMAGVDLPLRAIREQIAGAFDVLIHLTRLVDGSRHVTHVTEVLGTEADVITLQDIFVSGAPTDGENGHASRLIGTLDCSGLKPHFLSKLGVSGVTLPADFFRTAVDDLFPSAFATTGPSWRDT
jgi:pilus assembly protein CpaF